MFKKRTYTRCKKAKLASPSIISTVVWDLQIRLGKRRESDPAISWYDHCEAPST
ncbi:hypothetical protein [Floridanema aerugineum]|jgi:hypothetical protein|uniref:Uncharacterized protein n=1 Tax=Floridaenema aerugineum BLCC-F46 TaxID=3153654 RepID=A0ABV4WYJ1_9CYAN